MAKSAFRDPPRALASSGLRPSMVRGRVVTEGVTATLREPAGEHRTMGENERALWELGTAGGKEQREREKG